MSSQGFIRCGTVLDRGGFCTRRLRPGERCPDHSVVAPKDGSEPKPLQATPCRCSEPVKWVDDDPQMRPRCVRCGHDIIDSQKRRRMRPSKPRKQRPAGDPPRPFVPQQLELDFG